MGLIKSFSSCYIFPQNVCDVECVWCIGFRCVRFVFMTTMRNHYCCVMVVIKAIIHTASR